MKSKFIGVNIITLLLLLISCGSVPAGDPETITDGFWTMEDEVELYYFAQGRGTPVLVLHGGPGIPAEEPWKGASLLSSKYRFYYYHQRGCGLSTRPVDKFSSSNYPANIRVLEEKLGLKRQLKDIEAIRNILGVKKLILVGHSFGGFLAAMYALEYPEQVEKLVLIAPAEVLKMPQEGGGLYGLVEKYLQGDPMLPEYGDFMRRYFDYGSIFSKDEAYLQELANQFSPFWLRASEIAGYSTMLLPYNPELTGGWCTPAIFFSLGMNYDLSPRLKGIKAPVLLLHGDKDLIPPDSVQLYRDNFPNNRFEVITGGGHFLYAEQPELFAEKVGEFLK